MHQAEVIQGAQRCFGSWLAAMHHFQTHSAGGRLSLLCNDKGIARKASSQEQCTFRPSGDVKALAKHMPMYHTFSRCREVTWADEEVHDPVHPGLLVYGSLPAGQLHALTNGAVGDGRHVLPQGLPLLTHFHLRLTPLLCRTFQPHPAAHSGIEGSAVALLDKGYQSVPLAEHVNMRHFPASSWLRSSADPSSLTLQHIVVDMLSYKSNRDARHLPFQMLVQHA